jgi:hypothetical protein
MPPNGLPKLEMMTPEVRDQPEIELNRSQRVAPNSEGSPEPVLLDLNSLFSLNGYSVVLEAGIPVDS